jgi:hypothetical protein
VSKETFVGQLQAATTSSGFSHTGFGIVGSALHMVSRLRDHIERIDNGVVYAVDDLAVVLRALMCHGQGNSVLRRLHDECGVNQPSVLLSRAPAEDSKVQFSIGSIPTRETGAIADGAAYTSLSKWPNNPVLVVKLGDKQRKYTWDALLSDYANKWGGAHLDAVVPAHLQFIDLYYAGGLNLSGYLLRTAAVEVWFLAQNLFRQIFHPQSPNSFTAEELKQIKYVPEGGLNSDPRDISSRGQVQWFCHSTDMLSLLWYVDETSPDNAMHFQLGQIPYDLRYYQANHADQAANLTEPVKFQAPRHAIHDDPIIVNRNKMKDLPVDAQIKTLSQIRNAIQ